MLKLTEAWRFTATRAMAQSVCPGEIAIYGQWHKVVRIKDDQNRSLLWKAEGGKNGVRRSCFRTRLLTNGEKASTNLHELRTSTKSLK